MRFWIESPFGKKDLEKNVRQAGFSISRQKPDFVITYGGDGTILESEWKFPGIPKIPIKRGETKSRYIHYDMGRLKSILKKIRQDSYMIFECPKVEASAKGRKIEGMNEIQVHSRIPVRALRFSLLLGRKRYKEIIGDGLAVATPYGSTGYYNTMGYRPFNKGLRLGLNNTRPALKAINVAGSVKGRILRERAWLAADNNEKMIPLNPGDSFVIRESKNKARFVKIL